MRLTAKDAADRLGISYVVAAGLLSHLEDVGKAKVVEKKFHASGKGKPTRVYEVDQNTVIDFGSDVVVEVAKPEVVEVAEEKMVVVVVEESAKEPVAVPEVAEVAKIETLDHVAAAIQRLKEAQSEAA